MPGVTFFCIFVCRRQTVGGGGDIEPCQCAWSSPCILVPKPDGSLRFVTDFWKVNQCTKTDTYPIPRIEDCIDKIGQAKYVSKFDLLKGYWGLILREFTQCLCFVPPTVFTVIKLWPLVWKTCPLPSKDCVEAYIDDVVVYSQSWDEHIGQILHLFPKLAPGGGGTQWEGGYGDVRPRWDAFLALQVFQWPLFTLKQGFNIGCISTMGLVLGVLFTTGFYIGCKKLSF